MRIASTQRGHGRGTQKIGPGAGDGKAKV